MNKSNVLIFLQPFNIANPTPEDQMDFMICETLCYGEYYEIGKVYDNAILYDKNLSKFIPAEVKRLKPRWIVAEGDSATIAMKLKRQKKVLINPKITFDDLNNVSDYTRENTWAFFDRSHEQDYNRFQTVYPNSGWFPEADNLNLLMVNNLISEIVS